MATFEPCGECTGKKDWQLCTDCTVRLVKYREATYLPVPQVCSKGLLKSQLVSLCIGLQLENIDELLTKPPDYFLAIGNTLAGKMIKCKCK